MVDTVEGGTPVEKIEQCNFMLMSSGIMSDSTHSSAVCVEC